MGKKVFAAIVGVAIACAVRSMCKVVGANVLKRTYCVL